MNSDSCEIKTLNFYHSFPRRTQRYNAATYEEIEKGLIILESILDIGLLLVPEIREFVGEINDKDNQRGESLLAFQRRFCLTQLAESELSEHGKIFGNFHLEFLDNIVRILGAIPVFYIPQPLEHTNLALLGNTFIHRLAEIQDLLYNLTELERVIIDSGKNHKIILKDELNSKSYKVCIKELKGIVSILKRNNQDFQELLGAISVMSSLFYPTEHYIENIENDDSKLNHKYDRSLWYYRQREWRIIGGISLKGKEIDQQLNQIEKNNLLNIDCNFFGRFENFVDGISRIIDQCRIIRICDERHVRYFIKRIIVPKEALQKSLHLCKKYGVKEKVQCIDQIDG